MSSIINLDDFPGHTQQAFIPTVVWGLCCAFIWAFSMVLLDLYHYIGMLANTTTSHAKTMLGRGKRNNVEHSRELLPFHPDALVPHEHISPFELLVWSLDKILGKLTGFGQTLLGMVSVTEILQSLAHMSSALRPLNTRLNWGIAQMSTLRDQVVANGMVIFRYLCPIILRFLFVGLVVVAGASVGVTILVCSGVLVLVAAGGVGAGGEGESNLTPGRSRTGIFATLFRQAEAL